MSDVVRINVSTGKIEKTKLGPEFDLLSGRAFTSRIVHDEVPPTCHPLSADNKLIVATGLLGGTGASCVNRVSFGAKSPLTGGIKESNCGGVCGFRLARLGIRALIFDGKPQTDAFRLLVIGSDGIRLDDGSDLRGLGNYELVSKVRERYGNRASSFSIGPAGEMRLPTASIASTDIRGRPSRQAGRGGLGAVMGSKGIKGVVILDAGKEPKYHDAEKFKSLADEFGKKLVQTKAALTNFGTASLVRVINEVGGLPVRNYTQGVFEKVEEISGENLREVIVARGGEPSEACMPGCVIRCSNLYNNAAGEYVTSAFEFETIVMLGANCGIGDLDVIARLDYLCDDLGIDTIETGAAIAVGMEGGLLEFGDGDGAVKLVEGIYRGDPVSRMIAGGTAVVGRAFGVERVPVVKGQSCVAYDPRSLKGMGVSYATSPMGADHTSGPAIPGRSGFDQSIKYDVTSAKGQTTLSHDLQIMIAVCDSLGWCFFVGPDPNTMALSAELLNAKNGTNLTKEDIIAIGINTLKIEKEFNQRAGFTSAHDRLPDFFSKEPLPPSGRTFDVKPEDLDKTLVFD